MRTFLQKKLWRDKLIDIMEHNHGSKITWRQLDDKEFNSELRIKLREETEEVIAAQSHHELIAELADVYEVINTLATLNGISTQEIIAVQAKKQNERGGFLERKFVEIAQHPIGSFGEEYCLNNPEKYPEII